MQMSDGSNQNGYQIQISTQKSPKYFEKNFNRNLSKRKQPQLKRREKSPKLRKSFLQRTYMKAYTQTRHAGKSRLSAIEGLQVRVGYVYY